MHPQVGAQSAKIDVTESPALGQTDDVYLSSIPSSPTDPPQSATYQKPYRRAQRIV